ncbi:MAG: hypothetical protein HC778_06785, partial [Chamaesiphon sp. CSU_1_12]|nr:hypothetical protein [Chamaesiphon sp. CSU_1_12]
MTRRGLGGGAVLASRAEIQNHANDRSRPPLLSRRFAFRSAVAESRGHGERRSRFVLAHPRLLFGGSGSATLARTAVRCRSARRGFEGLDARAFGAPAPRRSPHGRRNAHYFQMIQSLAKHYAFDIERPWTELPERVQQALLYGSGEEPIEFRYPEAGGRIARRKHAFEGILPNLERRYRETESQTVRDELAKYLGVQSCPDCSGQRLNRTAR